MGTALKGDSDSFEAQDEEISRVDGLRDRISKEFEEDPDLVSLISFDPSNSNPPTEGNWGIITVSSDQDDEAIMVFVREHAGRALSISSRINARNEILSRDPGTEKYNFYLDVKNWSFRNTSVSPDVAFQRAQDIKTALVKRGGFPLNKYPNLFNKLTIGVSDEQFINFSESGYLFVHVNVNQSLEENLDDIEKAASIGNPKVVRESMNIAVSHDGVLERRADTIWLIHDLQKQEGDAGIDGRAWAHFIEFDDRDIAPSRDTWGHMTVNTNADDEAIKAFVLKHIPESKKLVGDISKTDNALNQESRSLGFGLILCTHFSHFRPSGTPDVLFGKAKELIDSFRIRGGFENKKRGPYLSIEFGDGCAVRQIPDLGVVTITADINTSVDQNLAYIEAEAEKIGLKKSGSRGVFKRFLSRAGL